MASGKSLTYHQLWRSSWKMWLWLVAATAVPIALIVRWGNQSCMYCIKLGWLEVAVVALLAAVPFSILGLLVGFLYSRKSKDQIGKAFGVGYLRADHALAQRVHQLADQLALPRPQVGFMSASNAFAVGRTPDEAAVIIGTPLMQRLAPDELDAVIGHELGHIASGDMQRMQIAVGYQRLCDGIFQAVGGFVGLVLGIAVQSGGFGGAGQVARAVAQLFILLGQRTLNIGSDLSIKAFSRHREFHADAVGARLTTPDAMRRALQKIHGVAAQPLEAETAHRMMMFRAAWKGHLFSTHPTLEARLAALDEGTYMRHAGAVIQPMADNMRPPRVAHQSFEPAVDVSAATVEWIKAHDLPRMRIPTWLLMIGAPLAVGALSFWVTLQLL